MLSAIILALALMAQGVAPVNLSFSVQNPPKEFNESRAQRLYDIAVRQAALDINSTRPPQLVPILTIVFDPTQKTGTLRCKNGVCEATLIKWNDGAFMDAVYQSAFASLAPTVEQRKDAIHRGLAIANSVVDAKELRK